MRHKMPHTYYFSSLEYKYWNRQMIGIEVLHSQRSQFLLYSHQRGQNINTCQQAKQVLPNEFQVHWNDLYL